MKTFYYFLSEQPTYPNKIMARSKSEVKSLLMESLADESSIVNILSEEEMNMKSGSKTGAIYADAGEFSNGNDFMNAVIKSANNVATSMAKQEVSSSLNHVVEQHYEDKLFVKEDKQIDNIEEPTKFFEEAGIKFKLEHGKLYKKVWKDLSSDDPDFRIINIKTNKPVDSSKFRLEQLDWVEI